MSDYWKDVVREAIAEEAPDAYNMISSKQFDAIAAWVESCHDNYGTMHGYDVIANPIHDENDRLKKELSFIKNHECVWINNSNSYYRYGGMSSSYYCKHCHKTKTETY